MEFEFVVVVVVVRLFVGWFAPTLLSCCMDTDNANELERHKLRAARDCCCCCFLAQSKLRTVNIVLRAH